MLGAYVILAEKILNSLSREYLPSLDTSMGDVDWLFSKLQSSFHAIKDSVNTFPNKKRGNIITRTHQEKFMKFVFF